MAEGVSYPTEDPIPYIPPPPVVENGAAHHLYTAAQLAQLEHELLDKPPEEWAEEAAATITPDPQA